VESGKRSDRPQLAAALAWSNSRPLETLTVTSSRVGAPTMSALLVQQTEDVLWDGHKCRFALTIQNNGMGLTV
jgi:hypothetical protein